MKNQQLSKKVPVIGTLCVTELNRTVSVSTTCRVVVIIRSDDVHCEQTIHCYSKISDCSI